MCGRFVASRPVSDIADLLDVDDIEVPEELLQPRFNISPQAGVLAVANRKEKRRLTVYHWGLIPSWAKDPSVGFRSFNARAESLADRPAFRSALAKRRCLVPADAFYEWEKVPSGNRTARLPWLFKPADGGLLVFAGLWEAWRVPGAGALAAELVTDADHDEAAGWHGDWLLSCSIITGPSNDVVARIHDRMPVALQPDDWATWLEPEPLDPGELRTLLSPPPDGYLTAFRVGTGVNNSRLDDQQLIEPLAVDSDDDPAPTLFELPG